MFTTEATFADFLDLRVRLVDHDWTPLLVLPCPHILCDADRWISAIAPERFGRQAAEVMTPFGR